MFPAHVATSHLLLHTHSWQANQNFTPEDKKMLHYTEHVYNQEYRRETVLLFKTEVGNLFNNKGDKKSRLLMKVTNYIDEC